ncbi:MAG: asparagine synthase-related protein, partial [Planctomycetota bacterium]
ANTLSLCRQPLRSRLLHADVREQLVSHKGSLIAANGYRSAGTVDPLSGMLAADMATLLPDDYLVKVDRASMACGLEVRPPMLDHEFLELCARIPSRLKIHAGETKWLLRETAKSLLPESILKRPKQGFEIPVDSWLRGPLQEMFRESVLGSSSPVAAFVDQAVAARTYESHLKGVGRHGSTLWSLLALSVWSERYLASNIEHTSTRPQAQTACAGTHPTN